jgi:hypothetical protein
MKLAAKQVPLKVKITGYIHGHPFQTDYGLKSLIAIRFFYLEIVNLCSDKLLFQNPCPVICGTLADGGRGVLCSHKLES